MIDWFYIFIFQDDYDSDFDDESVSQVGSQGNNDNKSKSICFIKKWENLR